MSESSKPFAKGIRKFSLWCVWFVAPIDDPTPPTFWVVLVNVCSFTAILAYGCVLLTIATVLVAAVLCFPILFFVPEDRHDLLLGRMEKGVYLVVAAAAVFAAIWNIRYLANGTFQPVNAMDFFDWMIAAAGAIILIAAYLYVYLAATGQLSPEEDEDKPEKQVRKFLSE